MKTVGFIVNPISGMGGSVGLKGTNGKAVLEKAIFRGAKPLAPAKAEYFLSEFEPVKERIRLIVGAGRMGEDEARNLGFTFTVFGERKEETTSKDTVKVTEKIMEVGAELLIFAGGDGTARDIFGVIDKNIPVLGIPTGVKIHSGVFAVGPRAAARIGHKVPFGGVTPQRS